MCKLEGKHKKHNVLTINKSKDFIKTNLEDKMKTLKSESKDVECYPQEIEEELENIRTAKRNLMETITGQFNAIRKSLEEKEENILKMIDESYLKEDERDLNDLALSAENALENLSSRLSEGEDLLDKWGDTNTVLKAGDMLKPVDALLEENRKLKNFFDEICGCRIFVETAELSKDTNEIIKLINKPREFRVRRVPEHGPSNLLAKEIGPSYIALEWAKNGRYDKGYTIKIQKEGDNEPDPSSFIDTTENSYTAIKLEQNSTYKINVRAKRGNLVSNWSDPLTVKTTTATIENMTDALKVYCGVNAKICAEVLDHIEKLEDSCTFPVIYVAPVHF